MHGVEVHLANVRQALERCEKDIQEIEGKAGRFLALDSLALTAVFLAHPPEALARPLAVAFLSLHVLLLGLVALAYHRAFAVFGMDGYAGRLNYRTAIEATASASRVEVAGALLAFYLKALESNTEIAQRKSKELKRLIRWTGWVFTYLLVWILLYTIFSAVAAT